MLNPPGRSSANQSRDEERAVRPADPIVEDQLIGGENEAPPPIFPPQFEANQNANAARRGNDYRMPLLEGGGGAGGAVPAEGAQRRGNWFFSANPNGTYNVMCLRQLTKEFLYTIGLLFILAIIIVLFVIIA